MNFDADRVRRQILLILQAWGMAADLAETTAGLMLETDLMGIDSHGVSMLTMYEELWRDGALKLQSRPSVDYVLQEK